MVDSVVCFLLSSVPCPFHIWMVETRGAGQVHISVFFLSSFISCFLSSFLRVSKAGIM